MNFMIDMYYLSEKHFSINSYYSKSLKNMIYNNLMDQYFWKV